MGGVSKKPISSVEKRQKRQLEEQQQKSKKKVSKTGSEVISKNVQISDEMIKKIQEEIKKEKIITPYELATKANITISVAKSILKELSAQGVIKEVFRNRRTAIYVNPQT